MAQVITLKLAYNSLYLVEGGGERTLIDAGPDYQGAGEHLAHELGEHRPGYIAITHGHIDHAGLGSFWQARAARVAIGPGDEHLTEMPAFSNRDEWEAMTGYITGSGTPADLAREALSALEQRREWARAAASSSEYLPTARGRWPTALHYRQFSPDDLLEDGQAIAGGLRALHCPGHTPGNLVFVHSDEGWLFSGDQLLPTITPTPAIQVGRAAGDGRFRSLPHFVESLRRLREMNFERCFPGHGEPFDNVSGVVDANLSQIEQRSARTLEALREQGVANVYSLADTLYPRALRRRFWQIIATVQGHLDLLEDEGLAVREEGGYVER